MKNYGCFVAAVLGVVFAVSYATINGNYSVNVHFIPALVRGPCPFGQLWNPPNITCASCYCLTGQLSRCGPRPGCNPTANATATTTTTATPEGATDMTMPSTGPTVMQNQNPTTQSSVNPPATGTPASAAASSATPSSSSSAGSPAPTSAPASSAGTAAPASTAGTAAPAATTLASNKFRRGGRR